MAICIYCNEPFISKGNVICFECHDIDDPQPTVYIELGEDDIGDVDEIQENEDLIHDHEDYLEDYPDQSNY